MTIKAAEMAERMNIALEEFEGEKLTRGEDGLVKFYLRDGKRGKCRILHCRIFWQK